MRRSARLDLSRIYSGSLIGYLALKEQHHGTQTRRRFQARSAVRIALTSGLSRKQVASDLGIGFSTLSKWVQTMRRDEIAAVPQEDLAKENERLRKEVRLLKEERDILKKATVFFAEQVQGSISGAGSGNRTRILSLKGFW